MPEGSQSQNEARAASLLRASGLGSAAPFALANVAAAVASVAAVVILTRLLAAEGYGLYATIVGLVMIVQNAGYLCLQTSIIRFYARADGAEARHALATALRLAFLAATLVVTLAWFVAVQLLGPAGVTLPLALGGLALLVARGWVSLAQAWTRAEGRPWRYFAIEAVQSFGALGLTVAALSQAPGEPAAALWGGAVAAVIAGVCSTRLLLAPFNAAGAAKLLREFAAYGAPLALVFLAGASLAVSDRLLIAAVSGPAAAGAYAAAFALADRAMTLVLMPVPAAVKPQLFAAWEEGGEAAARPLMVRSARWLIMLGFPVATVLIVAAEPIAQSIAGGGLAADAARVMPWLAAGSMLSCLLTYHFSLAFQLARRTQWMLAAVGVPAVLNLAANLVLIPRFGMIAAGWTTVAGYALALALAVLLGRRHAAIPFPLGTAAATSLACLPLAYFIGLVAR